MPDTPLAADRSKFLTAFLLFLGCFCLYGVTMTNSRLGYEDETIKQAQGFIHGVGKIEGKAGLLDIAFYAPFVLVDDWIREARIFWSFHGLVPNFALPFEMALTAALVFLTAVEIWPRRRAAAVAAVFAFGTMAWPYAKMGADTTLTFATALAFWGLVREIQQPGKGGYALGALGLAAMMLTKVHAPVLVVLMTILLICGVMKGWLKAPTRGSLAVIILVVALTALAFVWGNRVRYGRWFMSTSYGAYETTAARSYFWNLMSAMISPGRSLFIFNPPLLLAACLAPAFCRRHGWFADTLFIFVLPQILFHVYFQSWAEETWGPRRLINLLPVLVLPLGHLADMEPWSRKARKAAMEAAVAAGVAFQLLAVSMNYASYEYLYEPKALMTHENMIWNPETAHPRFQAWLAASCVSRWIDGKSLTFRVEPEYLPWHEPEEKPAPIDLDLSQYDRHFDFWWAAFSYQDPNWSWRRQKATYLLLGFVALGLTCMGLALRRYRGDEARE